MAKWLIGGSLLAGAVVGVCYLGSPKPIPPVAMPGEPITIAAIPAPEVSVPMQVVEVTDIDMLLDPPPIPAAEPRTSSGPVVTAVGYDEPAMPPLRPASAVVPIPPAAEDEE